MQQCRHELVCVDALAPIFSLENKLTTFKWFDDGLKLIVKIVMANKILWLYGKWRFVVVCFFFFFNFLLFFLSFQNALLFFFHLSQSQIM